MPEGEKLAPNHASPERGKDNVAEAAGERLEKLKSPERSGEHEPNSQEQEANHARKQAELEAVFGKDTGAELKAGGEPDAAPAPQGITRTQKQAEYKKTMGSMQKQLSTPARAFSKVIHNPAVEKASDVTGSTVARPNAILAGSFVAFVAVLGVYLLARYNGFRLSGFETIAAFAVGWAVGVGLDLLRVTFSRRTS